jgi:hypothetical protein
MHIPVPSFTAYTLTQSICPHDKRHVKALMQGREKIPYLASVSEQAMLETNGRSRGLRHPVERLKVDACHSASDTFATRFQDQFRRLVMFCCRAEQNPTKSLI